MKTNYQSGHDAEKAAADYLRSQKYKIIDLNWTNRKAEVDIIAQKGKILHFVEVKSRKNSFQGLGLEYITPKKLAKMQFAAEMWVQENSWDGQYQLSVVSIDGGDITFIESLDL